MLIHQPRKALCICAVFLLSATADAGVGRVVEINDGLFNGKPMVTVEASYQTAVNSRSACEKIAGTYSFSGSAGSCDGTQSRANLNVSNNVWIQKPGGYKYVITDLQRNAEGNEVSRDWMWLRVRVESYVSGPNECGERANPVNLMSGAKVQEEELFSVPASPELSVRYIYNSLNANNLSFVGYGWQIMSHGKLSVEEDGDVFFYSTISTEVDGKSKLIFESKDGVWVNSSDDPAIKNATLSETGTGYIITFAEGKSYSYNLSGLLVGSSDKYGPSIIYSYENGLISQISDEYGRIVQYLYNADYLLSEIIDPEGNSYYFQYDDARRLINVTPPGSHPIRRTYHYEDDLNLNLLTGITDENRVRYASWSYDNMAFPVYSEHAGGVGRSEFTFYGGPGKVNAVFHQTPLGLRTKYESLITFVSGSDFRRVKRLGEGDQVTDLRELNLGNHPKGLVKAGEIDWNGNLTSYQYDSEGREIIRSVGEGLPESRATQTVWDANFPLPASKIEQGRTTAYDYDQEGRLIRKIISD